MSKNIIIVNNGTTETWESIGKIRTSKHGGGSEVWLPEDETTTGEITITANGQYDAADDGLYAYSKAIVNINAVRGTINGTMYEVTVDENGYLVETPVEE